MAVSKASFIRKSTVLGILVLACFVASLYQSDALSNILSPLNDIAAAGLLYFAYRKSHHTNKVSLTLLLYAVACAVWGIADIAWAAISFGGGVPEESPVLYIIYVATNCILVASLVVFAFHQFRKWEIVQFGIDLIISGLMTVVLFWILFLHKDSASLMTLLTSDFTSVLSLFTDILICISIFTWFLSIRGGKIPGFLRIISFGLVLFALSDMLYYYLDYNGLYFPSSMSDFMYTLSLVIIAYGGLWKTYKSSSVYDVTVVTNVGGKRRWLYLLLYPLVAVLFSLTGAVQINVVDILTFALLIFMYWASCKYVQLSLEKEALLRQSNEVLERRVAEQVQELTFLANQGYADDTMQQALFHVLSGRHHQRPNARMICWRCWSLIWTVSSRSNDMFGHDIGDRILIDLSYRMIEWNSYGATCARLGGDEFAVMFVGKYTQKDIEELCSAMIDYCGKPYTIDKKRAEPDDECRHCIILCRDLRRGKPCCRMPISPCTERNRRAIISTRYIMRT